MNLNWKRIILWILIILIIGIGLEFLGIGWTRYFGVKHENVRRKVFEQTKSYNQGKLQDLAKYYQEYQKSTQSEKEAITTVIKTQFADYDENNIENVKLKTFLMNVRGY
jgi:hypothetical protein